MQSNKTCHFLASLILLAGSLATASAYAQSIVPNPDVGAAVAGVASKPIANVAANDTINGAQATLTVGSGNAHVSVVGTWPSGVTLGPLTGAVSVTAAVPAGVYRLAYQLCDRSSPANCASTTDTVTLIAVIANADNGTAAAGVASTPVVNVAANDSVNGAAPLLGSGGNAVLSQVGTWSGGLTLNTATGAVSTVASTPPGPYSLQYQICDLLTPADCATGTVTVTVAVSIVANPDSGSAVAGIASTPIANVAANDTINGAAAILGAAGNAVVSQAGAWSTGLALNTTTGAITVDPTVSAGMYPLQYQLCDLSSPPNCTFAVATVTVAAAPVVANPDSGTADAGIGSQPIGNVASNDFVNGVGAVLGTSGNATIAKVGTWTPGISLNTATGAVTTTNALAVGSYTNQYQLCDLNPTPNCATANVVISVINGGVIANPDTGSADVGVASQPIANVATNDSINGTQAVLGTGGNAKIAKVGTWPPGLGLSGAGAVSTTASLAASVYTAQYQICDLNTPAVCSTTTVNVTVAANPLVANPETGTADFGISSQPIANVAANDTVNGVAASLGTGGNAQLAKSGTWATGIALNNATGAVTTTAALAVGTYPITYKLCDRNVPSQCVAANDSISVVNATVVANAVTGTADFGVGSQPIANVTSTDTVNGAAVILGAGANATVAMVGTWTPGIALISATGAVNVSSAVSLGVYTNQYKLCDLNVPATCSTNTVTINVISSAVTANPDAGTADFGLASQPVANVAANDTINGAQAVLGAGGNAQITKVGTWPNGLGLNPTTGAVSTQITSADGVWMVQYQLCDLNTPASCSAGNVTVTIISASILANPITAHAVAGVGSTPITNLPLAAADTVNGAQAVVGTSGNAQLTTAGTWPTGIAVSSQTGNVTVAKTVTSATYELQYLLCDLNVPANCAAAMIEIDVTTSVVANPETGTAVTGKASTPIKNVANNDTINGVQAHLQTSQNATVSQVGTWPTGIALNTTTGAVTTTAAVLPGAYNFTYQLCSLAAPTNCATAADTLMVDSSLVVVPVAGSGVVGQTTIAIANVAANDIVNGAPAVIGTNAVVSQVGSWTPGISLNTSTGAVTIGSNAVAGNYPMYYQLCDKSTPPGCATAIVDIAVTQNFAEVLVSPYMTGDIEFDWARDGIYCPSCNFGSTNSQVNWTDRENNLWVSYVNPTTGVFTPISGKGNGVPVDTVAFFWQDWGNGPEWAFSTPPGSTLPISQLVYTGYQYNEPATWAWTGSKIATQVDGTPTWVPAFSPGAFSPVKNNTILPEPSQCITDPVAYTLYQNLQAPAEMYTEPVNTAPGTAPTQTPFGGYANGIGERWVACAHDPGGTSPQWLTFQGNVSIGTSELQQVFWYDLATQATQQLTTDPTTKQRAVMFKAPDFPDAQGNAQYVLMTLAADSQIQIYLQNGTNANGSPIMKLINTIYSPDPVEPYMFDPKIFIHCSQAYPLCRTFVVVGMSEVVNSQQTENLPNGLGLLAIDPQNPMFEILVPAQQQPAMQRLDPKYFITAQGPVVYYNQFLAAVGSQLYQDNGIWMISLQMGAPFGPCVGSSAHEGLNSTWPNCTPPPH